MDVASRDGQDREVEFCFVSRIHNRTIRISDSDRGGS